MNDLEKYFRENTGRLIHKWNNYFEVYDQHFSKFRGTEVHILEFGVSHGGSLQMWKDYFGPKAKIYGVDINKNCKQLEEDQVEIFIGDQQDRTFLQSLGAKIPRIDILIDDGGHTMKQQIATFEELFPKIDKNGVYLCEDLHTSYWPEYGGGYKRRRTYIEYSKNFIDSINAWHSLKKRRLAITEFTKSVHSLHYYDGMLVIHKRPMEKPYDVKTGTPQGPDFHMGKSFGQRIQGKVQQILKRATGR
jgi:hypothetical protein